MDAFEIALADGDDVICGVEHVFDLCPPFIVLEGEGVNIIAVPGDHKGGAVVLLEAGTGVALWPREVCVYYIEIKFILDYCFFNGIIEYISDLFILIVCRNVTYAYWENQNVFGYIT